jgi:hypothetical protein
MKLKNKIRTIGITSSVSAATILNLMLIGPVIIVEPSVKKTDVNSLPENKERPLSVEEHIRKAAEEACKRNNLGDYCVKDLMAITKLESSMMKEPRGDGGHSYGPTHIHLPSHPEITKEQAMNIQFALNKTLEWMIDKGYPVYRTYAIQCHNGCTKNNGYAQRILTISRKTNL